jgi:hypothetical protein
MLNSIDRAISRSLVLQPVFTFRFSNISTPGIVGELLEYTALSDPRDLLSLNFHGTFSGCAYIEDLLPTIAAVTRRTQTPRVFVDVQLDSRKFIDKVTKLFSPEICDSCENIRPRSPIRIFFTETFLQQSLNTDRDVFFVREAVLQDWPCVNNSTADLYSGCIELLKGTNVTEIIEYVAIRSDEIFLLSLKTSELYTLLLSSDKLLSKTKFLFFEYRHQREISVQLVSRRLWSAGFQCFMMTTVELIPMNGWHWHAIFDRFSWMNIFCGQMRDRSLRSVVRVYNGGFDKQLDQFWDFFDNSILAQ